MKVLLIAYEFPPIPAAQSLRWLHLSNELIALGVDVEVLCPDIAPNKAFPMDLDPRVTTHRVWPGPFIGLGEYASKRASSSDDEHADTAAPKTLTKPSLLSRGYGLTRTVLNSVIYPDLRTEWYFSARKKLKKLLSNNKYNFVISSHEPAIDIFLGFYARKIGIPWIVDLGDPLLTPYSPPWRRFIDFHMERRIMRLADHLVVTDDRVVDLLSQRHGADISNKISTISQGFPKSSSRGENNPNGRFNICFTGHFYSDFRNPARLAEALRIVKDIKFSFFILGNNAKFHPVFDGIEGVEFLGYKNHADSLEWQSRCDLLINIGNVQSYQVPGKIYEYLGAGKPILHIQTSDHSDPGAALIEITQAGTVVNNNAEDIASALRSIHAQWTHDPKSFKRNRNEDIIQTHTWHNKALSYQTLFTHLSESLVATSIGHHRR